MLPATEPCCLESLQRCWVETCMFGLTSLLCFGPGVETHVLILDDCTIMSCCVQSWSTLPALPVDFYLKPAEELKHLLWKWGGGRGKKGKLPKSVPDPGGPVSLDSLPADGEKRAFFRNTPLKTQLQALRSMPWGRLLEGQCAWGSHRDLRSTCLNLPNLRIGCVAGWFL